MRKQKVVPDGNGPQNVMSGGPPWACASRAQVNPNAQTSAAVAAAQRTCLIVENGSVWRTEKQNV